MKKTLLIVISGKPASGKTTLAKAISSRVALPLIHKDAIKEILFDQLGWSDREWSKKLGVASYGLMDYFVVQQLKSGHSLVVESNFKPEFDTEKFRKWKKEYDCEIIQIICRADPKVLFERFSERAQNNERHLGHRDSEHLAEWKSYFLTSSDTADALDVESRIKYVDTTDFSKIDNDEIVDFISNAQ